jgi:hypothetical protein
MDFDDILRAFGETGGDLPAGAGEWLRAGPRCYLRD